MRYAPALLLGFALLMCGCVSRDEVLRVGSPDGQVDAVVFETNCGAPCSFGYDVELVPRGARGGDQIAALEGAVRNEQAWGVNLNWLGADKLSVEYLRADQAKLFKPGVKIGGHNITVTLRSGVNDPAAPAGGMLYNRR